MKYIKYTFLAIILLIAILTIGSYIAIANISTSYIAKLASDAIGREVQINGEISPNISLTPSIKISKLTIANAEWAGEEKMLNIGELEIAINAKAALSGDIEISKISIIDSKISIEQKEKWNFEFESKTDDEAAEEIEEKTEEESELSLAIHNINITNSEITVKQDGKKSSYLINSFILGEGDDLSSLETSLEIDKTPLKLTTNISSIKDIIEEKIIEAEGIKLSTGEYNISGGLTLDMNQEKPYIKGNLSVADIDLSKGKKAESESTKLSKEPLPLDILQAFNADLNIDISSVKIDDKIKLSNIKIPAKIANGSLKLSKLSAYLAKAQIIAYAKISQDSSAVKFNTKNLELARLFLGEDFDGGLTNIDANITAKGNSIHSLVNSLSGDTNLHLKDATYSGETESDILGQLLKLLAGGTSSDSTQLDCVITNITWANGIGEIKDLEVINEFAIVTGKGKIKLPTQKIKTTLYPEAKNIGLTDFIVPPIAISGEFTDLSVYPDPAGTALSLAKTAAGVATGAGIFNVSFAIGKRDDVPVDFSAAKIHFGYVSLF